MTDDPITCAHAACMCPKPEGRDFCSDYCEQASGGDDSHAKLDTSCGCGHRTCETASD
jgi:hypothetical protein